MDLKLVPQMTLREYYAGLAMQAIVSRDVVQQDASGLFARQAELCFLVADAMIKAGEK